MEVVVDAVEVGTKESRRVVEEGLGEGGRRKEAEEEKEEHKTVNDEENGI